MAIRTYFENGKRVYEVYVNGRDSRGIRVQRKRKGIETQPQFLVDIVIKCISSLVTSDKNLQKLAVVLEDGNTFKVFPQECDVI